mmetsp:Transcript_11255/g.23822  ORF Transcript_11255/g.23822 Transcript_11255/m.23822 type:complete len:388 (-) Transcript_11255:864-2027(-)
MFLKKSFAVFVASTYVLSASFVSAGTVRGVGRVLKKDENKNKNKNDNKQNNSNSNDNKQNNNNSNNNNSNDNNNTNNVVPQITAPIVTVPPPTPSGAKLWISECKDFANELKGCMGGRGSFEGCTTCIYTQSLLSGASGNGVISCANMMCDRCKDEAVDFYDCGTKGSSFEPEPVTPPVVPPVVTSPVTPATQQEVTTTTTTVAPPAPVVVPVASVESQTTSEGCPPSLPSNGQDCTGLIPAPYLFHQCSYPDYSCSCRTDSPYYMCHEDTSGSATFSVEVVLPTSTVPSGVLPVPVVQPDDSSHSDTMDIVTAIRLPTTCTDLMPTSGLTGCNFPPDEVCCYAVQLAYANICRCGEDKKFSCVDGIPSDCPNDQNPNYIATILPSF